jgi:hypothetical protein
MKPRVLVALAMIAVLGCVLVLVRSHAGRRHEVDQLGRAGPRARERRERRGGRSHRHGSIEGTVVGPDSAPLADAIVALKGPRSRRTMVADANGKFAVRPLPVGSFEVSAGTAGGAAGHVSCEVRL